MTDKDKQLWEKMVAFNLDDAHASFSFTDRLARENGWSLAYSIRAVHEYKKFIFLICAAGQAMTPSDQVDQVWHLHLIYTESYWKDWCGAVLGREVHHGPTKGGKHEEVKYADLYARTLSTYTALFGQAPPEDIWPPSHRRFADIQFERVSKQRYWIVPKPKFLTLWRH